YLRSAGRVMYLGGNGFYWMTTLAADRPWMIELRRGHAANRAWSSEPGEEHHASTGERGGAWRHLGRPPNALVGVGFAAQGWDLEQPAPGYRVHPQARDSAWGWTLAGIGSELIGDYGLVMGGAAGDELDRYDAALGSPPYATVLATAGGHGRHYLLAVED